MIKIISAIGIALSLTVIYKASMQGLKEARKGDSIAQILFPKNDTRIKHHGVLHWQQLSDKASAQVGDTVFTGENSTTTLALQSGSEIQMNPHSVIILQDDFLDLETGSLKINLRPGEKIKTIRIAGKKIKLDRPGTFNIVNTAKGAKVEFVPLGGGAAISLLDEIKPQVETVKTIPSPSVNPAPVTPIARATTAETPKKPKPAFLRPSLPVKKKPVLQSTPDTHELAAAEQIPAEASDQENPDEDNDEETEADYPNKWSTYVFASRVNQEHEVSVKGSTTNSKKDFKTSGNSLQVRGEVEHLIKYPITMSLSLNSFTGSTATYSGFEFGVETILRSSKPYLKNFDFMPGIYLRQYTLEMEGILPANAEPSEVSSSSLMLSFTPRWQKQYGDWTAELWPQIKGHSKDGLLLDYALLAAIGKNTKIGRFSAFWRWQKNEDHLDFEDVNDTGDADIKTTENRLGLMYNYHF